MEVKLCLLVNSILSCGILTEVLQLQRWVYTVCTVPDMRMLKTRLGKCQWVPNDILREKYASQILQRETDLSYYKNILCFCLTQGFPNSSLLGFAAVIKVVTQPFSPVERISVWQPLKQLKKETTNRDSEVQMGIIPKMVGFKVALSYSKERLIYIVSFGLCIVPCVCFPLLYIQERLWILFFVTQSIDSARLEGKGQPKFTTGRWNPHHSGSQIATANDATIRGWDVRTMRLAIAGVG